jgi:opacity protein-like surface antigen
MKNLVRMAVFLSIIFSIFSAVSANAENSEITFFAGGFLGDNFVYNPPQLLNEINASLGDNFLGGFRLAYFLNSHFAVEGGLGFTPGSVLAAANFDGGVTGASIVDVDTYVFNANIIAHLLNGPVIPFLTAGVAAVHFSFDTPTLPGVFITSETDAAFNAGGGVKVPVKGNTALRFDGRYYWINPQFSFEEDPRFVEVSGGVAILFNF